MNPLRWLWEWRRLVLLVVAAVGLPGGCLAGALYLDARDDRRCTQDCVVAYGDWQRCAFYCKYQRGHASSSGPTYMPIMAPIGGGR